MDTRISNLLNKLSVVVFLLLMLIISSISIPQSRTIFADENTYPNNLFSDFEHWEYASEELSDSRSMDFISEVDFIEGRIDKDALYSLEFTPSYSYEGSGELQKAWILPSHYASVKSSGDFWYMEVYPSESGFPDCDVTKDITNNGRSFHIKVNPETGEYQLTNIMPIIELSNPDFMLFSSVIDEKSPAMFLKNDDKLIWKGFGTTPEFGTHYYIGDKGFMIGGMRNLCFSLITGEVLWETKIKYQDIMLVPSGKIGNEVLFSQPTSAYKPIILAMNLDDGSIRKLQYSRITSYFSAFDIGDSAWIIDILDSYLLQYDKSSGEFIGQTDISKLIKDKDVSYFERNDSDEITFLSKNTEDVYSRTTFSPFDVDNQKTEVLPKGFERFYGDVAIVYEDDKISFYDKDTLELKYFIDISDIDYYDQPRVIHIDKHGVVLQTSKGIHVYRNQGEKRITFQVGKSSYSNGNDNVVNIDVSPVVKEGRTYLPARFVTEPLGGSVTWDSIEKKVSCSLGSTTIGLWINKAIAMINDSEVQIDSDNPEVAPLIINNRTFVPMRFLAESLGCEVEWVAETKEIILTYTP